MDHQNAQRNHKKEAKKRKKKRQKDRELFAQGPIHMICMKCMQLFPANIVYPCKCQQNKYCSANCRDSHNIHLGCLSPPIIDKSKAHSISETACLPIAPGGATVPIE